MDACNCVPVVIAYSWHLIQGTAPVQGEIGSGDRCRWKPKAGVLRLRAEGVASLDY